MFAIADDLLRARGDFATGRGDVPWRRLALLVAVGAACYGAAMGSFGARAQQALYSACKVPLLLGVATLVCLPNFYVVNVLLGLRDDFSAACRGIFAAQATLAVALAALAPFTLLLYVSTENYDLVLAANGLLFALGTIAGQITLGRHYRELQQQNPRHRFGRRAWLLLYVFVAIQMAWVLRPFVGAPGLVTTFLREDAWTNAYVALGAVLMRLFAGG